MDEWQGSVDQLLSRTIDQISFADIARQLQPQISSKINNHTRDIRFSMAVLLHSRMAANWSYASDTKRTKPFLEIGFVSSAVHTRHPAHSTAIMSECSPKRRRQKYRRAHVPDLR